MQSVHSPAPIVIIILAAVVTSIILGLLLRRLGTYSELSILGRLGLLIILAIGVGFIIFTSILYPNWLLQVLYFLMIIPSIVIEYFVLFP